MSNTETSLPTRRRWGPVHIVEYLIVKSGLLTFTTDRRVIHETFLRLQPNRDLGPFLAKFVFSEKVDPFPFSRLLESVLDSLQLGEVIAVKNFQRGLFEVNREIAQEILEEATEVFDHQELIMLNRGARQLPEILKLVELDIQKYDARAWDMVRFIQSAN